MIVITGPTGQMGNRLFLFAHFIGFAEEHGVRLMNPAFGAYAEHFVNTAGDALCQYPGKKRRGIARPWSRAAALWGLTKLFRLVHKYGVLRRQFASLIDFNVTRVYRMDDPRFVKFVLSRRVIFIEGWLFRDRTNLKKHAMAIRRFFQPLQKYQANIAELIAAARRECDVLVGVHIRRRDFKTHMGGRYYFDDEVYRKVMRGLAALLTAKRVRFLICSDEVVNPESFVEFDWRPGTGHAVEDMYSLARCNYLIGPMSTFSGWASFYGEVPWHRLDANSAVTMESFRSVFDQWVEDEDMEGGRAGDALELLFGDQPSAAAGVGALGKAVAALAVQQESGRA